MEEKKRFDLLNFLCSKFKHPIYLEIGLQDSKQNFDKIRCALKTSVDPDPKAGALHCMTSDEFFAMGLKDTYDVIFLDGLHTAEQVKKDFENALKVLSPNGFIVLHDCNPLKEEHTIVPRPTQTGHWNGDVYKFATTLYMNDFVTVDIDNGCGVFRNRANGRAIIVDRSQWNYTWQHFEAERKDDLNLISWEDFIQS